jgi:hypothetical protein
VAKWPTRVMRGGAFLISVAANCWSLSFTASTPIVGIAMGIIMPSIIMGCTSTSGMPSITAGGDGAQRLAWGDLMDQSRNNHWQYDILMQGHSGTSARLFCLLSLE